MSKSNQATSYPHRNFPTYVPSYTLYTHTHTQLLTQFSCIWSKFIITWNEHPPWNELRVANAVYLWSLRSTATSAMHIWVKNFVKWLPLAVHGWLDQRKRSTLSAVLIYNLAMQVWVTDYSISGCAGEPCKIQVSPAWTGRSDTPGWMRVTNLLWYLVSYDTKLQKHYKCKRM